MSIYTPNKPMLCEICGIGMVHKEVVESSTFPTIPYYECGQCSRIQMSQLAKYVSNTVYSVQEMRLGFEANAAKYLKEDAYR